MKLCNKRKFDIVVASHYGMCFGVKAAIQTAQQIAEKSSVTILGELAHNSTVRGNLEQKGAQHGTLEASGANTKHVIITAHGTSDKERKRWAELGHIVTDTTCPLVHRAHAALKNLVLSGYFPIVIGKLGHVEVRGLVGDFPQARVVQNIADIGKLDIKNKKIGVISQTTQQIDDVELVINALKQKFSRAEVKFIDTVCRPTKERQLALLELCNEVDIVIVVGGKNSNNTAQLAEKCRRLGCRAYHVQSPADIVAEWFRNADKVGLTAGTSTPDNDVESIRKKLLEISQT